MEGRRAMLTCLLFLHVAHRECLASVGNQQHVRISDGDQVSDGSSWVPYVWDVAREGRHYGPVLPLARPRQRHDSYEPELLYAVWESPPILAKEGLTEEEADWVPDAKPLQTIKENYVFGSREFDHHFAHVPHSTVRYTTPHTTPPPPPPTSLPSHGIPMSHTEAATPDTPAPAPHTDIPIPHTDTPTSYTPIHTHPFPSHHPQPFKLVLPLRRRPRKYFLAGDEDKHKHEDSPSHSGPFRKYYIDPASKGVTQHTPPTPAQSLHPHFFPDLPPVYSHPHYPRPPPTVRQYFLQPPADQEPHVANLTSFEVYDKLRKTRTVDTLVETEARTWVVSGVPKASSWVSSSSGHRHS